MPNTFILCTCRAQRNKIRYHVYRWPRSCHSSAFRHRRVRETPNTGGSVLKCVKCVNVFQLNFISECIRFPVRLRIPLFSRFGTLTRPRSSTFPARRTGSPRRFTSESCFVSFCRFRCSDGHREDNRARVGGATALHGSDRLVLELFSRSPCTLLPSYMPLAILTMDRRRSFG